MSSQYYTQTPNFISATSEDVDPRTRLFGFQQNIGRVTGNNGMGPQFDFTMTYSATTSDDLYHLGIGVLVALSLYDKNSGSLSLNSGESFQINESGGTPEVQQKKINTFQITKFDDRNYRIFECSGEITDLQDVDGSGVCRPVKIYSPLGHTLSLTWSFTNYGMLLQSVTDDEDTTLCSLTYDGRTLTYDEVGRLVNISGKDGGSQYGYDGMDRLVMQCLDGADTRELYYCGASLVNEVHVEQSQHSRFIPGGMGSAAVSDEPLTAAS